MAREKQHVFSARTTEEGLRLLSDLRKEKGIGWDEPGHRRHVRPLRAGQGGHGAAEERGACKGAGGRAAAASGGEAGEACRRARQEEGQGQKENIAKGGQAVVRETEGAEATGQATKEPSEKKALRMSLGDSNPHGFSPSNLVNCRVFHSAKCPHIVGK